MANVVLEAMASGLAIVTTRTGAAELIQDNGIVIETADPASIHRALGRYLMDPALLARHQRQSRILAEAMPWRSIADGYLAVYRKVWEGARARWTGMSSYMQESGVRSMQRIFSRPATVCPRSRR